MDNPTIEKLICDPSFIDYCMDPDSEYFTYWHHWIHDHPQYEQLVIESKALILQLHAMPSEEEVDRERLRLSVAIEKMTTHRHLRLRKWLSYAAACAAIVGGSIFLFQQRQATLLTPEAKATFSKQHVPAGKYMNIKLTDGTQVRLGPASMLDYPDKFASDERLVTLKGDAFFDVAHRNDQPFIIQTTAFQVKVLGTSFNMHAFEEDELSKIALFTGKVEILRDDMHLVIVPGQVFIYNNALGTYTVEPFDRIQERESMQGILHFRHATYSEIGKQLSRKYGIVFQPNEDIQLDFSGSIAHESLEQVLEKLTLTTSYRFYIESNTLIVRNK